MYCLYTFIKYFSNWVVTLTLQSENWTPLGRANIQLVHTSTALRVVLKYFRNMVWQTVTAPNFTSSKVPADGPVFPPSSPPPPCQLNNKSSKAWCSIKNAGVLQDPESSAVAILIGWCLCCSDWQILWISFLPLCTQSLAYGRPLMNCFLSK